MNGVTALELSYDRLHELVGNLGSDQLDAPTPCLEWNLRTLLDHTLGAARMFTLANRGQAVGEDAGDVIGDDAAGAVKRIAAANIDSWRQPGALQGERKLPFGSLPAPAALMINVCEIAVHTWDMARATGQDASMDPQVAAALYEFYRQVPLDQYRAHGAFGPQVEVPDSASVQDRLLGYLGRRP